MNPTFKENYLTSAIDELNSGAVEALLASRVCHANEIDRNGHVPLHLAIDRRAWRIARTLLQFGADPNAKDQLGRSGIDKLCDNIRKVRSRAVECHCGFSEELIEGEVSVLFGMIQKGAIIPWQDETFLGLLPQLVARAAEDDQLTIYRLAEPFLPLHDPYAGPANVSPKMTDEQYREARKSFYKRLERAFWADRFDIALVCGLALMETSGLDGICVSGWLFRAADAGKPNMVRVFLKLGADPTEKFEIRCPFKDLNDKLHSGSCRPSHIAQYRLDSTRDPEARDGFMVSGQLLKSAEERN